MLIPLNSSRFFIFYYIFELGTQLTTHYLPLFYTTYQYTLYLYSFDLKNALFYKYLYKYLTKYTGFYTSQISATFALSKEYFS